MHILNALQEQLRSHLAHAPKRLANRREAWRVVDGAGDVVKAYDGNILRAAQAGIHNRPDSTDGGNIVKAEDRGKVAVGIKQITDDGIAKLR